MAAVLKEDQKVLFFFFFFKYSVLPEYNTKIEKKNKI